MTRRLDLSHLERQALLAEEQAAKARAEEAAVIIGVLETTALEVDRGAEFIEPERKRGEKQRKPIRRATGLRWLHGKNLITDAELAVGERYGAIWRVAEDAPSIRSNLNPSPGGGSDRHRSIQRMLGQAEVRLQARNKLANMASQLSHSPKLLDALAQVAGRELTPREASRNGAEAAVLQALVLTALDILARAE